MMTWLKSEWRLGRGLSGGAFGRCCLGISCGGSSCMGLCEHWGMLQAQPVSLYRSLGLKIFEKQVQSWARSIMMT